MALESGKESVEDNDEIGSIEWIDVMMRRSFSLPKSIPTIDDVVDGETSYEVSQGAIHPFLLIRVFSYVSSGLKRAKYSTRYL